MSILKKARQKKEEAQKTPISIDFTGMEPLVVVNYRQEYGDVMEALTVIDKGEKHTKTIAATVVFLVLALLAIPRIFAASTLLGVVVTMLAAYLVAVQIFGATLNRKRTAKEAAATATDCQLQLYATGIQVRDADRAYNVPYRVMNILETKNQFVLRMGNDKIVIFPKRFFGDQLKLSREILQANLGVGRRYQIADEKGNILSES